MLKCTSLLQPLNVCLNKLFKSEKRKLWNNQITAASNLETVNSTGYWVGENCVGVYPGTNGIFSIAVVSYLRINISVVFLFNFVVSVYTQ